MKNILSIILIIITVSTLFSESVAIPTPVPGMLQAQGAYVIVPPTRQVVSSKLFINLLLISL